MLDPARDAVASARQALHLPDWPANPYQPLLADGIRASGWGVEFENYPKTAQPLSTAVAAHEGARVVHLHWTDPYFHQIVWASSSARFIAKTALLAIDLLRLRAGGRRIVWTVHNEVSHESRNVRREIALNRTLARLADHLIFHSESARARFCELLGFSVAAKSSVVPHGNYVGCYQPSRDVEQDLRQRFGLAPGDTVVIAFGAIRAYKGIPGIIRSFTECRRSDLHLIVAGKAFGEGLAQEIESLAAGDPRIHLLLRRIDDREVGPLLSLAHAMVFGFEKTLTSGSVMLAMSHGLATILPERARVIDIVDDRGGLFFRDERHLSELLAGFRPADVAGMGDFNLKRAEAYDWKLLGGMIARIYEGRDPGPAPMPD